MYKWKSAQVVCVTAVLHPCQWKRRLPFLELEINTRPKKLVAPSKLFWRLDKCPRVAWVCHIFFKIIRVHIYGSTLRGGWAIRKWHHRGLKKQTERVAWWSMLNFETLQEHHMFDEWIEPWHSEWTRIHMTYFSVILCQVSDNPFTWLFLKRVPPIKQENSA